MLSFKYHIGIKGRTAIWNLNRIRSMRHYQDQGTYVLLIYSLVLTHLYYSIGILFSATDLMIDKLQEVQNFVARDFFKQNKHHSASESLKQLNWLAITKE